VERSLDFGWAIASRLADSALDWGFRIGGEDEGQGLSEHTAPFDALTHILDGEAEITISGKAHQVRAGEIIIMPANKPHALKAVCRFKMMLVMIRS